MLLEPQLLSLAATLTMRRAFTPYVFWLLTKVLPVLSIFEPLLALLLIMEFKADALYEVALLRGRY